jgi:hypothetical protein
MAAAGVRAEGRRSCGLVAIAREATRAGAGVLAGEALTGLARGAAGTGGGQRGLLLVLLLLLLLLLWATVGRAADEGEAIISARRRVRQISRVRHLEKTKERATQERQL